ncbi:MAG: thioesterase family protein [Porticoccaceae bacterium]|nr:thioesterase family protein [Porticoccaceae bacterium]
MQDKLVETIMTVLPEWVDYNGHMNLAFYVLAFDKATDNFYDSLDIGLDYRAKMNSSMFTLGINVDYMREVFDGDEVRITTQLLDCDDKRMRYIHYMYEGEDSNPVAMNECFAVHVDMEKRKSAAFPASTRQRIDAALEAHSRLSVPKHAGRVLGNKLA